MEQDVNQINGGITISVDASAIKEKVKCEKDFAWNLATCNCENGKHLAYIMDDSTVMCDEAIK